jgi:transcriptional regulator with XRE-family HTH domain
MACIRTAMIEDFRGITTRLRRERGMTLEDLAFEARRHAPAGSVSLSLIQKRLAPASTTSPSIEMLEALAAALGVPPETYPEWRLAQARLAFDEREVGLEEALETLSVFETALIERPTARARRASEQASRTPRQTRASRPEASNRRAT